MQIEFSAKQIAEMIGAEIVGNPESSVHSFGKIEEAQEGQISFLANPKYLKFLANSRASVIIIDKTFLAKQAIATKSTLLTVDDAYAAFTTLLQVYQSYLAKMRTRSGVHPQAVISSDVELGAGVYVGALSFVGAQSKIGEGTDIAAQCYIGDGVRIGRNCTLQPGVKILDDCVVGDNVVLHAGVVIGADGFGFSPDAKGVYSKVPQIGNVVIGNGVEIGANTTIDRATMGSTQISDGVKIDNLVQIAHNVRIGAHTVIAAQAGISGSTHIGKHCIIGGQAGLVGHISLADGTRINAQSGVSKSVNEKNKALTGSPAFEYYLSIKTQALQRKLPELFERVANLEKEKISK